MAGMPFDRRCGDGVLHIIAFGLPRCRLSRDSEPHLADLGLDIHGRRHLVHALRRHVGIFGARHPAL